MNSSCLARCRWCAWCTLWKVLPLWLLTVCGCHVGPDYFVKRTPVPDQWHQDLESGVYVGAGALRDWWTIFNDPILNDLVARAEARNIDLYTAATRIRQARFQECTVRSARIPSVGIPGAFRNSQQSLNAFTGGNVPDLPEDGISNIFLGSQDLWSTSFDVSWEPDVWGQVAREMESAAATREATIEAYRDVMVTLQGDVARAYIEVRTFQQRLNYSRRSVTLQKKVRELVQQRVEGGVSSIVDLHQADSTLGESEAAIPPLEAGLHQALNRLAVLLGEYPGELHGWLSEPAAIPPPPDELPVTLPRDMVRQRPDIRRAEREIAARTADIGVAIGDLYPQFSLTGTFGVSARQMNHLFDGNSFTYGVGPSFQWAIFQGHRIRCNIGLQRAETEEAIATYEQTLLLAMEEIENSIVRYDKELNRQQALQRTIEAATATVESTIRLYRIGESDFLNVLDAQRTLFIVANNLATSDGQVVLELVSLYKALGGGWKTSHHCRTDQVRLDCPSQADSEVVDVMPEEDDVSRFMQDEDDELTEELGDGTQLDRIEERSNDRDIPDPSDGRRPIQFEDNRELPGPSRPREDLLLPEL